jgi:hypothetical protein
VALIIRVEPRHKARKHATVGANVDGQLYPLPKFSATTVTPLKHLSKLPIEQGSVDPSL